MFLLFVTVSGQVQNIDSLIHVLETERLSPVEQLSLYEKITLFYVTHDLGKGTEYAREGIQLAEKEKDKKKESAFYRFLGAIHYYQSKFDTSRIYLDKALSLAVEINDKPFQVMTYSELGNLYYLQNNYSSALEYYMKGLTLNDGKPNRSTAAILVNMANIHRTLNHPDRRSISVNRHWKSPNSLRLMI
ncbi:MAG: tetratricopeptide repeat protein [Bacteroidales bacterium]|nr:tetratricopeptide repeat protein [Bacteroidales bacterium]